MTQDSPSLKNRKLVIAAIVVAAITPILLLSLALAGRDSQTYRFVIAPGTRAALSEGRPVDNALPKSLSLQVGDSVEIVNQDSEAHTYAFMVLRPGETVRHTFRQVGTFIGECTVNEHEEVTITVS